MSAEQIAVLVLGSGGREHALCWKLAQSPLLSKLWCAPGNPGTARVAENVPLDPCDPATVVAFCRSNAIGLVVVGPEAPLVAGVSDALEVAGIPCFGPSAEAARIEGSKAYAKEIMLAAGVPTAAAQTFDDPVAAEAEARRLGRVVVKADGLAAGKGVVVASDPEEAAEAVRKLSAIGAAGTRLVLEEVLEGEEVSVIALCDGERHVLLPTSQDHKRVGEGDRGPNTGGMGAVSPVPFLDADALEAVRRQVIEPTLRELARRGTTFRGALYVGVMVTADGPKVLEFNARFGDPETQVLMLRLSSDLLPVLLACANGALEPSTLLQAHPGFAAGVVLAAEGYPDAPKNGAVITGLDAPEPVDGAVFLAGVGTREGALITTGGRVLTVCARGATLEAARESAYEAAGAIRFDGMHLRRDIGWRVLRAS